MEKSFQGAPFTSQGMMCRSGLGRAKGNVLERTHQMSLRDY